MSDTCERQRILAKLQQDACQLSLSYLLVQLSRLGFCEENIRFISDASDYSRALLIESVEIENNIVRIVLNMGYFASQSWYKSFREFFECIDDLKLQAAINQWLKVQILMMYPELNQGYSRSFRAIEQSVVSRPMSRAQVYLQFQRIFPELDFSIEIQLSQSQQGIKNMRLGVVKLADNQSRLGEVEYSPTVMIINFYDEEVWGHERVKKVLERLQKIWVAKYQSFWLGVMVNIYQSILNGTERVTLPAKLSGKLSLAAPRRLLANYMIEA